MTNSEQVRPGTLQVEGWGDQPHWGVYAVLFLVSMGLLTLEISLTRLFSYTVWYHFAYLTISVALLGFGAGGAIVAAAPKFFERNGQRRLIGIILAAAALVVVQLLILTRYPIEVTDLSTAPLKFSLGLLMYYLAVGVPFLLAGFAISIPFAAYPRMMGRLYFWDLLGASLGCLTVVWLIEPFGVPGLILAAAAILLAAASALSLASQRRVLGTVIGAVSVALFASAPMWSASMDVYITKSKLDVRSQDRAGVVADMTPEKLAAYDEAVESGAAYSRWTALNRVDAIGWENPSKYQYWGSVGAAPGYKGDYAETAQLTYDGSNGSAIYSFKGTFEPFAMLDTHLLRTPYLLTDKPNTLVIGVGGGIDMMNAIKQGSSHVTGAELQPKTVALLKEKLRAFTGDFYHRDDVTLIASEGRHFVRKTDQTFDLVQITSVDTFSAQATGAYILAESYLYTVEAFEDYLDRLSPNGVLSLVIGGYVYQGALPPYGTRVGVIGYRALERYGVAEPSQHLLVVAARAKNGVTEGQLILVKKSPFTADEVNRVKTFAAANGFTILYAPATLSSDPHQLGAVLGPDEATRQKIIDSEWFRVDAVYDSDPFLYNVGKWSNFGQQRDLGFQMPGSFLGQVILLMMIGQSLLLAMVLISVPLLVGAREGLKAEGVFSYLVYFLSLGIGFMFIEISFVQSFVLFLGSPTFALSVTIFSLLLFSSIGSFLSMRFTDRPAWAIPRLTASVVLLIVVYTVGLNQVFSAFLHLDLATRIFIAVLAQIPIGLTLGMFMPLGIACVSREHPRLVPWAWGVNGIGSVVGTTLAVVLAMSWGFETVKACAAVLYVAGAILMVRQVRSGSAA
jgi:hypothetical protein